MDTWSNEFIRRHQIEILERARREHASKVEYLGDPV
jgi:hypothetical protein